MQPTEIVAIAWGASELLLGAFRRSRGPTGSHDRGSFLALWGAIAVGITAAHWLVGWGRLPGEWRLHQYCGAVVMIAGIGFRAVAIYTLGRFFTVNVAVAQDHQVVQSGLYRFVRHPSYTGALLTFIGYGLGFGSWVSLLVLVVPVGLTFAYRIRVEERALTQALGPAYASYASHTKRLIPFVF